VKIVAVTASAFIDEKHSIIGSGMDDYHFDLLVALIQSALGKKQGD